MDLYSHLKINAFGTSSFIRGFVADLFNWNPMSQTYYTKLREISLSNDITHTIRYRAKIYTSSHSHIFKSSSNLLIR